MSIPPDSPGRGCGSNYPLPVTPNDILAAQGLAEHVYYVNCRQINETLDDIVYRPGYLNCDVIRRLFRWDSRPYQEIFETGFQAWEQEENNPDTTYYNLYQFVQNSGAPLDQDRRSRHAFVSTTLDTNWRPSPSTSTLPVGASTQIYRYEIYAPGGIWVSSTLGSRYQFTTQDEVCFVGGVAPHYVLSAQLFNITRPRGSRYPRVRRADNTITINRYFNPMPDPDAMILIQAPVFYYVENNVRMILRHKSYPEQGERRRRAADTDTDAVFDWYSGGVAEKQIYTINAAFRASATNEVYMFIGNDEYVLLNYAPGSTNDRVIGGPKLICDGFHSLIGTPFGEYGINCAFDTDGTEAFIFCDNLCAKIDYAPATTNDKILSGPMTIASMFPFFKHNKMFENGVDAAFKSNVKSGEAYLFRSDQYARINYTSKTLLTTGRIRDGFPCLIGTIFAEQGIDAAFASHHNNEAYIFKGEYYALIRYVPDGKVDDHYLVGGKVKLILPNNWPSLRQILPRQNAGLDFHNHSH